MSIKMSTLPEKNWFTESFAATGAAFSLAVETCLHQEKTAYQHIAIYQTQHFGRLMVIDDCIMLTDRDNFLYHEMITHPALFSHEQPKNVVIIGGGDCGTLQEVLKHKQVHTVHQVEIDERVTRLAEQYFPELCKNNEDPRARLCFEDGIAWMSNAADDSLDVILIDSTDPVGPAEGLFNHAFYQQCFRALRQGGILAQQSESPFYHAELIRSMREAMRSVGFSDLATLPFPQIVYPSGYWSISLARKQAQLSASPTREKNFATRYYNADIHRASFAMPEFLKQTLQSSTEASYV